MMTILKRLYWSARWKMGGSASRLGELIGVDELVYNPAVMDQFGLIAAQAAPILVDAVLEAWPDIESVADIGCGTGHYVQAFTARGVSATGYERSEYARAYAAKLGVVSRPFDLTSDHEAVDGAGMALSLEVAEHLTPELGNVLIELLTRTAPRVVFSAAQPGQGGNGHVNEQPLAHWQDQFARHRYRYLPQASHDVRTQLGDATRAPWLARNVMLFSRG